MQSHTNMNNQTKTILNTNSNDQFSFEFTNSIRHIISFLHKMCAPVNTYWTIKAKINNLGAVKGFPLTFLILFATNTLAKTNRGTQKRQNLIKQPLKNIYGTF